MWHHDPLVTKLCQKRIVGKCQIIRIVLLDLARRITYTTAQPCIRVKSCARARADDDNDCIACARACCARAMTFEHACLVVLARYELEIVVVLVNVVVISALLAPYAPTVAITSVWLRYPLHVPVHEKLKRRQVQDAQVRASEAIRINIRG